MRAARRLARVDCHAAQHGCHVRWQALGVAFWSQILLTKRHCASQHGYDDFESIISDRCSGFFMVATAEEEASFSRVHVSTFLFFTLEYGGAHWQRDLNWSVSSFQASLYLMDVTICNMRRQGEKGAPFFRYHAYFNPSQLFLKDASSFTYEALFSI